MLAMLCTLWMSGAVFLHACILCMHAYGGERTAYRSRFSPSPMWALGFELGSLGLATSAFTSYIISMILGQFFF